MTHYTIHLFGIFRDMAQSSQIQLDSPVPIKLGQLRDQLETKFPDFKRVSYMIAVNHEYCIDNNMKLNAEDEIAFLPPVAGG